MLTPLLASLAFASWTQTAEENGCTFFLGSVEGNVQPVRAECEWPIPPEELHRLVAKTEDHDLFFSSVEESDVLGPAPGGKTLVYQKHVASGISDREIMLVYTTEDIAGGKRYSWTKAPDQSKLKGEGVPAVMDTGKWEISSSGNGSRVIYELRYDAGGSVPGFVVRWFQGAGTRALVGELRAWADTH